MLAGPFGVKQGINVYYFGRKRYFAFWCELFVVLTGERRPFSARMRYVICPAQMT